LGISTPTQSKARARARARMLAKGHILTQLQQPSIDYLVTKCGGREGKGGEGTTRQSKSQEGVGGLGNFPSQRRGV
jgi:hypothetical protein